MLVAGVELIVPQRSGFGLVIEGAADQTPNYLDPIFADPIRREAFWQLVDAHGLVVAKNLTVDETPYRKVRGRRSPNKMSQGELFHHDGCKTPVKPRVVEIRCPMQPSVRSMGTSVAAFPDTIETMLGLLPPDMQRQGTLAELYDERDWHGLQGEINRLVRRLDADEGRAFFHEVDAKTPSYTAPWTLNESRFIANNNHTKTAQHRRACAVPWVLIPNGRLIKRWPAEEMMATDGLSET